MSFSVFRNSKAFKSFFDELGEVTKDMEKSLGHGVNSRELHAALNADQTTKAKLREALEAFTKQEAAEGVTKEAAHTTFINKLILGNLPIATKRAIEGEGPEAKHLLETNLKNMLGIGEQPAAAPLSATQRAERVAKPTGIIDALFKDPKKLADIGGPSVTEIIRKHESTIEALAKRATDSRNGKTKFDKLTNEEQDVLRMIGNEFSNNAQRLGKNVTPQSAKEAFLQTLGLEKGSKPWQDVDNILSGGGNKPAAATKVEPKFEQPAPPAKPTAPEPAHVAAERPNAHNLSNAENAKQKIQPMHLDEILTTSHRLDAAARSRRSTTIPDLDDTLDSMEKGLLRSETIDILGARTNLTLAQVGQKIQTGQKISGGDWGAYKNYFSSNYASAPAASATTNSGTVVRTEGSNNWFRTAADKLSEMRNEGKGQSQEYSRVKDYIGEKEFKVWKKTQEESIGWFERHSRKLVIGGTASLGLLIWQGLDNSKDPNDDLLSPLQKIEYKWGLAKTGLPTWLGGEHFTNEIKNSTRTDPVTKAQQANLAGAAALKQTADSQSSAAAYDAQAQNARTAPPLDLGATLANRGQQPPTAPAPSTLDSSKLNSRLSEMADEGYIKPEERTKLRNAWETASKAASPVDAFKQSAAEILSDKNVGRDRKTVEYLNEMIFQPS